MFYFVFKYNALLFFQTEMKKFIQIPTEESFHELSDIGSESILDRSNIERERVSPVSACQVNKLCSAVQNIQENQISTNVQGEIMHTSTSAFYEPPVLMPSSVTIQGPSVNQRLHENPTAVNSEIDAVSAAAPSTSSTRLYKNHYICCTSA